MMNKTGMRGRNKMETIMADCIDIDIKKEVCTAMGMVDNQVGRECYSTTAAGGITGLRGDREKIG